MAWIKRNLFFAVGLALALLLLAAAAVYDLHSLADNAAAKQKLNEIYDTLTQNGAGVKGYVWGDANINNIQTAKNQTAQVQKWIEQANGRFKPTMPIPDTSDVTSEAFASALRRTIDQLQHAATDDGVDLPPKYAFSFEEQRSNLKYTPGSLSPLSLQLGEVKSIVEIFFAARVNSLVNVQRTRVSDDDNAGPQADYVSDLSTTNDLADRTVILTPYAVMFCSFSSELAAVLAGFAASPHGFIITGISVAPAGQAAQSGNGPDGMPLPPPPPVAMAGPGRTGTPTVLNEKLLRITLQIKIVKLLNK
jgi:hypothetical protein